MKHTTIASLIGLLFASNTQAADSSLHAADVVVTATRIAQPIESTLADVTVITSEQIERSGQSTLAELLRTEPGIEIESNGGVGATSNIHIRGTSSQAVVVLVDGMRVSSATLGTTNFSQIQPEQIERIEIVRGPASSLYGSDAIGGVIQIFTKQGQGAPHVSASAGVGSYNTKQSSAMFSGSTESTRYSLGVASLTTDGISSLRTNKGVDGDKDAYRNLNFNGNITHTWAEGQEIGAQAYSSEGHYNFDGNNFRAYQDLRQQIFALTSKNRISNSWVSNLRAGESMDDVDSVGSFGTSAIRTNQRQYSWQNDFKLPLGNLVLAYDRVEDKVKADVAFTQKERTNNGYLANYLLQQGDHAFKFGMRRDNNSQFGDHNTGNIGYGYRITPQWRVAGSFGTAFRAPTFNDLYWPFQNFGFGFTYQGNPDLKPETSRNKEISLTFDQGHHRVSTTVYHNKVDNLIVGSQGIANDFPVNVGTATIKGVTVAYEGWFSRYHLRASADLQDPRNDDTDKLLSRRSRTHGSVWLGQNWGKLELGSEVVASGKRYNDAANDFELGGYALFNMTAKYKLDDDWSLNARLNNLFDRRYALSTSATSFDPTAPVFGTPGANIFVSLRYSPSN